MESRSSAVLGAGDWVMYDGGEHQVVALAGTSVRLRSAGGADTVVLAAYLMASPGFAVVDGAPVPTVEPFGLLDALPDAVIEAARVWEGHVMGSVVSPNSRSGQTLVAVLLNRVLKFVPRSLTATMMTMAMRATIRPYSTAVAPRSSLRILNSALRKRICTLMSSWIIADAFLHLDSHRHCHRRRHGPPLCPFWESCARL